MSVLIQGAVGGGEGGEQRQWKDWILEKETELRLEVPEDAAVDIKVGEGPILQCYRQ